MLSIRSPPPVTCGASEERSGVSPVLIREPLAPLGFLPRRQRLPLAPDARLFVVLALLELGEEPGLLALLLEALERHLEGLVGLDDDLRHAVPPPAARTDIRWVNDNYIPCDGGSGKLPPTCRSSSLPRASMMERTPLWPPWLPFIRTRTIPSARSMSSYAKISSAGESPSRAATRATGGPLAFMKATGLTR